MTDLICQSLRENLHPTGFGEGIACDYHARPKTLPTDDPVLCEAIRLVDHPQLQLEEWPDGWVIDAARCSDHAVDKIVEPTRGYEEALVRLPMTVSNGVVSVSTPTVDAVRVLAVSPATEGLHPMTIDQQLLDASVPGDHGISRWTRVIGMLAAEPPDTVREHIENLIERSPETPQITEEQS